MKTRIWILVCCCLLVAWYASHRISERRWWRRVDLLNFSTSRLTLAAQAIRDENYSKAQDILEAHSYSRALMLMEGKFSKTKPELLEGLFRDVWEYRRQYAAPEQEWTPTERELDATLSTMFGAVRDSGENNIRLKR